MASLMRRHRLRSFAPDQVHHGPNRRSQLCMVAVSASGPQHLKALLGLGRRPLAGRADQAGPVTDGRAHRTDTQRRRSFGRRGHDRTRRGIRDSGCSRAGRSGHIQRQEVGRRGRRPSNAGRPSLWALASRCIRPPRSPLSLSSHRTVITTFAWRPITVHPCPGVDCGR